MALTKLFRVECLIKGVPVWRNTEIGLFSQQNSKNCIYFGELPKTGILSDTEILYFEGRNTAKFQYCLNSGLTLCQGVDILVPRSDQSLNT